MKQLETRHILLFRILRDHCFLLTRRQIGRVLTLSADPTNKELRWLVSQKYLARRYRVDTFPHFQTPLYYLGKVGWHMAGHAVEDYKQYQRQVQRRSERQLEHTVAIFDVLLKFILEADVRRIIDSENSVWQEAIDFGIVPDGWIQSNGVEAFIEVDRGTEHPIVMRKKFERYISFSESGGYRRLFPQCGFRVLVITTTEKRIEVLERLITSSDIWFCTMRDFLSQPLDHEYWFALRGFYALPVFPAKEVQELQETLS